MKKFQAGYALKNIPLNACTFFYIYESTGLDKIPPQLIEKITNKKPIFSDFSAFLY